MMDDIKGIEKLSTETKAVKSMLLTKETLEAYNKKYFQSDEFLSNSLLTYSNRLSSPRENMWCQQAPQALMLLNPEVPYIYTGYEHEVGKNSNSFYRADRRWKIIDKIPRYRKYPNLKYLLVVEDDNGIYDVIERVIGQKLTESYAYMINNDSIDMKQVNDYIMPNDVLYKSTSFDDAMNYRYGKNANVVFLTCPEVIQDAVWVSDRFAESLEYATMTTIEVPLNINERFLNLYGNTEVYKTFPDINEDTRLDTLCAKRKIASKSMLYNLKDENLRFVHADEDTVYYSDGKVIDVEVFCNKPYNEIERTPTNAQIMYYYDEQIEYYKYVKSTLGKIITRHPGKASDKLLHIYHRAEDLTSGKPIVNGNSKFENMTIVFTVMGIHHAKEGNKITGRFGEKATIGKISPYQEMPVNQFGVYADIVCSPKGAFGRLNCGGQWMEQELTFLADNLVLDLRRHNCDIMTGMQKILEFINDINPEQANKLHQYYISSPPDEQMAIYQDMLNNSIKLHQPPFWGNSGFEEFRKLYAKYRYPRYRFTIKGKTVIRRLIMGRKYVMLLKQTPKSKYSSRSLGMQSTLGHPSKSIKYKKHNIPHSDTPIRLGEMELMNLCMMNDSKAVADFLSVYANSQENREEFVTHILTTDDPFCIYFKPVTRQSINRKMINALLKACGCQLL